MDNMRGWMNLETVMFTDQEKNAVKSSTGNKKDYQSDVWALKDQWDDAAIQRHDRAIHRGKNHTDLAEDCTYEYEPEQTEDAHAVMSKETDELKELEEEAEAANALAAQASRTLAQAKEAAAAARRDRNPGIVRQHHEGQWQDWMDKRGEGKRHSGGQGKGANNDLNVTPMDDAETWEYNLTPQ